jgi:hypothetical protein
VHRFPNKQHESVRLRAVTKGILGKRNWPTTKRQQLLSMDERKMTELAKEIKIPSPRTKIKLAYSRRLVAYAAWLLKFEKKAIRTSPKMNNEQIQQGLMSNADRRGYQLYWSESSGGSKQ